MNNTQEALLAIALSQSKILEISYLVEADASPDWKEGRVIRKPDGTFLKWKPSDQTGPRIPGTKINLPSLRKGKDGFKEVEPTKDVQEKAKTSYEELSRAIEEQSKQAEELLNNTAERVKTYRAAMDLAKDPYAKEQLDKEMRSAIKQVANRIISDENYVRILEKQVRKDANQEKVQAFTSSLDRLIGGDRIRKAPGNIAKSALEEGKAGADALASPQGRIVAATAGTVAAGVLVAALNRRKALNLIAKQVEKAAAKVATREAAKEAGAIVKDVGPIAKTLAKAEDSVPVVGAMIRSHRKEKAIAVSREATKEARETAEKALSTMQENDFDKAWDDLDNVFANVSNSIAKTSVVDTLANIVSKPYSEMKNLKLQSRGGNATSDAVMAVALNAAGLGDDNFSDEMMELLKSAGFKLSAEDIEAASETLSDSSLMRRISSELINSMCKH